jgi:hypothetical protein
MGNFSITNRLVETSFFREHQNLFPKKITSNKFLEDVALSGVKGKNARIIESPKPKRASNSNEVSKFIAKIINKAVETLKSLKKTKTGSASTKTLPPADAPAPSRTSARASASAPAGASARASTFDLAGASARASASDLAGAPEPAGAAARTSVSALADAPAVASVNPTKEESVKKYLQSQSIIRIGVVNAPGLGHQAAAVSTAAELRKMGFTGTIEFVCEDGDIQGDNKPSKKLEKLLSDQDLPQMGARIVSKGDTLETVDLAVYGACDHYEGDKHKELGAKNILFLQPHQWHKPRFISQEKKLSIVDRIKGAKRVRIKGLDRVSQEFLDKPETMSAQGTRKLQENLKASRMTFHLDLKQPDNLNEFVTAQYAEEAKNLESKGDAAKSEEAINRGAALNTLLDGCRSNKIDMMMTYGLDFKEGFHALISGIQYAQQEQKVKGTVLLVTTSCKNETLEPLPENAFIVDAKDPNAAEKIANLKDNQVLILRLGGAPKPVFTELIRESTLPCVYESANASNIGKLLGKPSMSWDTFKTPFLLPSENEESKTTDHQAVLSNLKAVEGALQGQPTNGKKGEVVGNYIIDAKSENSITQQYFSAEKREFNDPENNAILTGLHEIATSSAPPS